METLHACFGNPHRTPGTTGSPVAPIHRSRPFSSGRPALPFHVPFPGKGSDPSRAQDAAAGDIQPSGPNRVHRGRGGPGQRLPLPHEPRGEGGVQDRSGRMSQCGGLRLRSGPRPGRAHRAGWHRKRLHGRIGAGNRAALLQGSIPRNRGVPDPAQHAEQSRRDHRVRRDHGTGQVGEEVFPGLSG